MKFDKMLLLLLVVLLEEGAAVKKDTLKHMLDALSVTMSGSARYPNAIYRQIQTCFASHPPLAQSQESFWKGTLEYFRSNGSPDDKWGGNPSEFRERNTTILTRFYGMTLFEPCNYASNVAYYHMAVGVCKFRHWSLPDDVLNALVESSSALAAGSALFHGSHTRLGQLLDNAMIAVLSYTVHQAIVSRIQGAPPVITDLRQTQRPLTAVEISKRITFMFRDEPVNTWITTLETLSVPNYFTTFSATISTIMTLVWPKDIVDAAVNFLTRLFGVDDEAFGFLQQEYLPQLRQFVDNDRLSQQESSRLVAISFDAFKKLGGAFFWQEGIFQVPLVNKWLIIFGGLSQLANGLTSSFYRVPVLSRSLHAGSLVYPGEDWCKVSQPHSLWHSQSAAGLLDYFLVADYIYSHLR